MKSFLDIWGAHTVDPIRKKGRIIIQNATKTNLECHKNISAKTGKEGKDALEREAVILASSFATLKLRT